MSAEANDVPPAASDCPLPAHEQTQNLILYSVNVTLIYIGAPVLYVGITQASLCEKLNASKTVSNLPSTLYFWMTLCPLFVAWYFCAVRQLKPVLVACYLTAALTGAAVVGALLFPTPPAISNTITGFNDWLPEYFRLPVDWVVPAVLLHSGVLGAALVTVSTYQWEMIGRGVSESRRGQALGLAFGVGPILAFGSSLASQKILTGMEYPSNYAVLFAVTVPLMMIGAFLSTRFIVPPPAVEIARPPFLKGVFGGMGDFFSYRPIIVAAIAMVLVGSGYNIITNISLFTKQAIGEDAEKYVGIQNAIRFGVKSAGGLLLGWLLTRYNPKLGLLVTAAFCLSAVVWVVGVSGMPFLLSFGFMGIGELFGVYYPNYILSCSPKARMRRNMAITSLLNMPLGFISVVYGVLGDRFGLQASFGLSIALLVATLLIVQFGLPARPQPADDEGDVTQDPAGARGSPAGVGME